VPCVLHRIGPEGIASGSATTHLIQY